MSIEFDFSGWDKANEVGLITSYCGHGKTYSAVNELPSLLDAQGETLLLVPRVVIKEQTVNDYDSATDGELSAFGDKVSVATYHRLGYQYQQGEKIPRPKLVICDEWHTLFYETSFAEQLIYFHKVFEEWNEDPEVTLIVMTATDTLPIGYVANCPDEQLKRAYGNPLGGVRFKVISKDKPPRFKVGTIQIEQGKSLETILRSCPATPQRKQLVFAAGKVEAVESLAKQEEYSSWLCSPSNKVAGRMNEAHRKEVVETKKLPEGVNRLYLTSAYREGLNIEDESIQEVIIDATDEVSIIQSLGRVRHDIDRLIVVVDRRRKGYAEGRWKRGEALLATDNEDAFRDYYLNIQAEDEKAPKLVYYDRANDRYLFNYYALYCWVFSICSFACAAQDMNNESTELFGGAIKHTLRSYFEDMLGKFTDAPLVFNRLSYVRPDTVEEENLEKLRNFNWEPWRGVEVYGDRTKDFTNSIGLRNRDSSVMALSGIYKKWPDIFAWKKKLRREGKQIHVYKIR